MKSNPQRHAIALVTLVVGISVVALVVLERGSTAAAPDHSVYLPIVFKADTVILPPGQLSTQQFQQGDIFTTACLEVNQKVYPQGAGGRTLTTTRNRRSTLSKP